MAGRGVHQGCVDRKKITFIPFLVIMGSRQHVNVPPAITAAFVYGYVGANVGLDRLDRHGTGV